MNRREFLIRSALTVPSAVVLGASLTGEASGMGRILAPESVFSIDVLTNRPEQAIREVEAFLKTAGPAAGRVRFSDTLLSGAHVSDIVYVNDRRLVNYRLEKSESAAHLHEMTRALQMPEPVENPVLLRFQSHSVASQPTSILVKQDERLTARMPINQDLRAHRIKGPAGYVDIAVKDGSVQIVSASCRHKTCMGLGAISQPGESLVCIPSRIHIAIEGQNRWGVDGVTF